jgi:hypothetical protein
VTTNRPLPNIWASEIKVDVYPNFLRVSGVLPSLSKEGRVDRDLFTEYLDWPHHWEKRGGLRSPHIQFANSVTDAQLVAFVRTFGPVAANSIEEVVSDSWTITCHQSLEILRRERKIYAAALGLLTELEKEKSANDLETIQRCIDQICDGCDCWPREWQSEGEWRSSHGQHAPSWRFDARELEKLHRWRWSANKCPNPKGFPEGLSHSGAIYCGHSVLCALVNTFIPEVQYAGVAAYEAPAWDSRLFGMRPVLYYILRQDYLRRGGISLCANVLCNKFFSVERSGQRFCTDDCSRKQRQREYWVLHGATLRRKRLATRRVRTRKGRKKVQ